MSEANKISPTKEGPLDFSTSPCYIFPMSTHRFSKADVQTHRDYGWESHPAVNVKVHNLPYNTESWDKLAKEVAAAEYGDAPGFDGAYVDRILDQDDFQSEMWFSLACESHWEILQEDAEYIFDKYNVKVYSEGRQGGWAVVHGLPDIESWDAILLAKWQKFARLARSLADDIPREMVSLILINRYEQDMDELQRVEQAFSLSPYIKPEGMVA